MAKQVLKNNDWVYATGVYLRRDDTVDGGWIVINFNDDTFYEGNLVNTHVDKNGKVSYYTSDEDEEDDE